MWLTHGAAVDIKVMSLTVESANDMTSDMSRQREMASVDVTYYRVWGRGQCIIINNEEFKTLEKRTGSRKDTNDLEEVFKNKLGFKVRIYSNLTSDGIHKLLKERQQKRYTKYYCLFVIIMSHGCQKGIYGTDEQCISIDEIQSYFTSNSCPTLKGKPKAFIFQACRDLEGSSYVYDPKALEKDMVVIFATQRFSKAYRFPSDGTPFIQALVQVIKENADTEDFSSMMTMVTNLLSRDSTLCQYSLCQLPDIHSLLLSKLTLKRLQPSEVVIQSSSVPQIKPASSEVVRKEYSESPRIPSITKLNEHEMVSSQNTWPNRGSSKSRNMSKKLQCHCSALSMQRQMSDTSSSSHDDNVRFIANQSIENLSVEGEVYCRSPPPKKDDRCGLCIVIDNRHNVQGFTTSESDINAQLDTEVNQLCEVFKRLHYVVVPFYKLRRKWIKQVLCAIQDKELETLVVVILSEGRSNALYDSKGKQFTIKDIFGHFSDVSARQLLLVPKFFLFQTSSHSKLQDESFHDRSQLETTILPQNSVCIHISTDENSSIIPHLAETISKFQEVDLYSMRHVLEFTISHNSTLWYRVCENPSEYDLNLIRCTSSQITNDSLTLKLIAQIKTNIGRNLCEHITDQGDEFYHLPCQNGSNTMLRGIYQASVLSFAIGLPVAGFLPASNETIHSKAILSDYMAIESQLQTIVELILSNVVANESMTELIYDCRATLLTNVTSIINHILLTEHESDITNRITKYVDQLQQSSIAAISDLERAVLNCLPTPQQESQL